VQNGLPYLRDLPAGFRPYEWGISTAEAARVSGVPAGEILRFDANTAPLPPPAARPDALADALAQVQGYPHGGYPDLVRAIATYASVEPENIVLGAGADDLILLLARAFAGPGDQIAIANEPTYPLFRVAAFLAGADVGNASPRMTFCCRPHNPTGSMIELPDARPLVVDEAYHEFCGQTAALLDDGVVVIRTFSKAFAMAGARVGYLIAERELARELTARHAAAPISTLSAALALAALAAPPEVERVIIERERLGDSLRGLGLEPLPSSANFLLVPFDQAELAAEFLLLHGVVVRDYPSAIRITVLNEAANDRLVVLLARTLEHLAANSKAATTRRDDTN
jgi:histidinol-phosphate aminotransferase